MTNQQGAPEALRLADSYAKAHAMYCLEDLYGTSKSYTAELLKERHAARERLAAALVEAQQPATHVQNPAVIEHVAGDVSKNGAGLDMAQQPAPSAAVALSDDLRDRLVAISEAVADQDDRAAQAMLREILKAPQPSPTPQADSQPAPDEIINMAREQGLPETEIEGVFRVNVDDLGRMFAADRAARAPADSQPAPVLDERDDFEKVFPLPSGCIRVGTGYASTGYSNWAAHTHVERWQGWQARAARAPADNVLEDAARLDWLEIAGPTSICVVIDRPHDSEVEVSTDDVTGYGKTLREALDAAREQGGAT